MQFRNRDSQLPAWCQRDVLYELEIKSDAVTDDLGQFTTDQIDGRAIETFVSYEKDIEPVELFLHDLVALQPGCIEETVDDVLAGDVASIGRE